MSDLINRADAIEAVCKWCEHPYCKSKEECGQWIAMTILPSAELPKGDLISRADVLKYPIRLDHYDEVNGSREFVYGVESVIEYVEALPSADADRPKVVGIDYSPYRIQTTAPSADAESKRVLQGYNKGANTIQTIRHEELTQISNTRKAVESADAEPKWNCTANFVAEQLDRLRNMTDEERWDFFIRFFSPSADAVHGYTEWLEKIIVEAETFEWLCEDTPCKEWCDENCHYSSIQVECLRHLYEVSKGGAE